MSHGIIWELYKSKFPNDYKDVDTWFPCGKNTIRIRMKTKHEFIFIATSRDEWSYMPIKKYLKQMKGDKRM